MVNFQAFILTIHFIVYGLFILEHEHFYFITVLKAITTNKNDNNKLNGEIMELKCN